MEQTVNVYFVGTAGSGKSTLTYAFQGWMHNLGLNAITVNLDPGVEHLLYPPDIDIRDWIRLSEVMEEYGLGPNGAQVVCADLLALKAREVKQVIDEFKSDYVLIDTPGQMELFAFRESSKLVTDIFGADTSLVAFLFDPVLAKDPSGFVSLLLMCATIQFRFSIPTLNILSKMDYLKEEEIEEIISWSQEIDRLHEALLSSTPSMQTHVNIELLRALETIGTYKALIPISSETSYGMEDLYNGIQQIFFGGEDLTQD